MTTDQQTGHAPAHSLSVHGADDFRVVDGANLGDPLGHAGELIAGDVYMLRAGARRLRMALAPTAQPGRLAVAAGTECGQIGAPLHLDSAATFMTPDGSTVEALVLVELDPEDSTIAGVHLFPLARLRPKVGYSLVALDPQGALARFAETACVSFTRGTRITMATGRQTPVEDLAPGDAVLTRDHGPQKVRWIGQQTMRATGALAPIRILAGTLNNDRDLVVSPNHRLFIYQRRDRLNAGRSELLIKAKLLLNDDTVTRTDGGFVDYFQILFDRHEIIYAEGIATESLMVDTRTRPALPSALQDSISGGGSAAGYELLRPLPGTDTAALLRAASAR